jgi:hypothetical protein
MERKMKKTLASVLIPLVLSGCAGSPMRIASMGPDQLKAQTSEDLCKAYSYKQRAEIKSELISRKAISENEWKLVDTRKVGIGMGEVALFCAWGQPSTVNESVSAQGTRRQWVYRACDACKAQYVYTVNGKVTAMQD